MWLVRTYISTLGRKRLVADGGRKIAVIAHSMTTNQDQVRTTIRTLKSCKPRSRVLLIP